MGCNQSSNKEQYAEGSGSASHELEALRREKEELEKAKREIEEQKKNLEQEKQALSTSKLSPMTVEEPATKKKEEEPKQELKKQEASNSGSGNTTLDKMPPLDKAWRCKKHQALEHHVFVNYRVATDAETAQKLTLALSSLPVPPGFGLSGLIQVFLDKYCLVDGSNWEDGFLNGLRTSTLVVLLISEGTLEGIKKADQRGDNVLLEYEVALELFERGMVGLLPVFLGKYVDVEGQSLYKKFGAYDTSCYPDAKHAHPRSTENVRTTMQKLFKLQGRFVDPKDFEAVTPDIMKAFEKHQQVVMERRREELKAERAAQAKNREAKKKVKDPSKFDASANAEFQEAVKAGDVNKAQMLLGSNSNIDIDCQGDYGYTGLHWAAYQNYPKLAKLLLEYSADASILETYSNKTAHSLALQYNNAEVAALLEGLTDKSIEKDPALFAAVEANDKELAAKLLSDGADPNWINANYYGYTSLHYCAYQGHEDMAALLLKHGADTKIKETYSQRTAAELAKSYNHDSIAKLIQKLAK